jgi:hypothetical protein
MILIHGFMYAQTSVKVEVSADTIEAGQIVEITYTIENGQGAFEPPDLTGLPVISGPNTSSSMLYQNGKMTSSQSYSYILRPMEEGVLKIPGAIYKDKMNTIDVEPLQVIVGAGMAKSPAKKTEPDPSPIKSSREKRKF